MPRRSCLLCLALTTACLLGAAPTAHAAPPPGPARAPRSVVALRQAMLEQYILGVDAELAHQVVSDADVPALVALLDEPSFPRKDNVVAFLSWLDHEAIEPALQRFARQPAIDPDARRAARLAQADLVERGRHELTREGAQPPASNPRPLAAGPNAVVSIPDPDQRATTLSVSYATHVALDRALDDAYVDRLMELATALVGRADFGQDVSCCVLFERLSSGSAFGNEDDELIEIDDADELAEVLAISTARVKVVDAINFCAGHARKNVLGCSPPGGDSIVLVRMTQPADEAVLWVHELGLNAGLEVKPRSQRNVMATRANATHRGLNAEQCAALHALPAGNGIETADAGSCEDPDDDGVHSLIDNCVDVANAGQGDLDLDGTGDECETGTLAPIGPETETASWLDEPLELSWTRGTGQLRVEVQFSSDPEFRRKRDIVSTGFQFFPTDEVMPSAFFWTAALSLADGEPVYWRLRALRSGVEKPLIQADPPRLLRVNAAIAPAVTDPPNECPEEEPECNVFDIDRKDAPAISWDANHNTRYRVIFSNTADFSDKTLRAQSDYSVTGTSWQVFPATWEKLRDRFWTEGSTTPIWYRLEAKDALDRETVSATAVLYMKDLAN